MAQQLLVAQNEALLEFLDDLLTEQPSEEVEAGPSAAGPEPSAGDNPPPAEVSPPAEPIPGQAPAAVASPSGHALYEEDISAGRIPIIPAWARGEFQAMVFKVGELALAIPLVELAGVLEWKPEQVDSQTKAGLCLGHYPHAGHTVRLIDTARFILPAAQRETLYGQGAESRISRIILIDKGNIGLVCDEVFEVIAIQPEQVNWRSKRTRRKWLAGTMLKELIVVLDPHTTVELLAQSLNKPD